MKKTHHRGLRSVTPDGRKIKEFRERRSKTQKELLQGHYEAVSLRTYQRAEQGKPISRDNLEAISNILEVEVGELISGDGDNVAESAHLRLKWFPPASGSKLFATLRDEVYDLEIGIECEPEDEEAGQLAEMFTLLETLQKSGKRRDPWDESEDDAFLSPAEMVKAIGRLNSAILWLEEHKIRLFCGVYVGWQFFPKRINVEGPRGNVVASVPIKFKRAKIVFSSLEDDHLRSSKRYRGVPRDNAIARAIEWNLKNEVDPEDVKKGVKEAFLPWDRDSDLVEFETRYRDAFFVDRFGEPVGDPQKATDGEPEVPL